MAARAAAAAELLAFGEAYLAQIVRKAEALAAALQAQGIAMLGANKGFTRTHQAIADVREHGGGLRVAQLLEGANIIVNKNLLPSDTPRDWDHPGGVRIGATEVTRWGMKEGEMEAIAGYIADVLHGRRPADAVRKDVIALRRSFPSLQYCYPLAAGAAPSL
jgi:glycine hydroxymethyltransferase